MSEASDGGKPAGVRRVAQGAQFEFVTETVDLPNGRRAELDMLRHPGASAVVPFTASGRVVLVRQHRHATGGDRLESPAGKPDPGGPDHPERGAGGPGEEAELIRGEPAGDHPEANGASVLLEPAIEYDHLIQVMDAVRTARVPSADPADEDGTMQIALFTEISIGDAP